MAVDLTALHWIYLLFIGLIIGFMLFRRDTSLVCIIGIFLLGLVATHSVSSATIGIFNSFIYAIKELLGTILVISIIVAMSHILTITGINDVMIRPFAKLIRNPFLGFWVIGILMMTISWFFWPSPAVALMGAVLLPVAARVGLPAIGVAVAMNLFGHGIALSSDFVIQGAPKLTSEAAGIPVSDVLSASVPLVFTMGIITTIAAYLFLRRDMKKGTIDAPLDIVPEQEEKKEAPTISTGQKKFFALMIPILFAADLVAMTLFNLQGGDATALIGGTSIVILIIIALITYKNRRR